MPLRTPRTLVAPNLTRRSMAYPKGGPFFVSMGRLKKDFNEWAYLLPIVVDAGKVGEDLTDFPIYVDMSLLPPHFHDHVRVHGQDIVITLADGITRVPLEVVFYDHPNKLGELHFKANLNATQPNTFIIYYGNPTATHPNRGDPFGSESVWTNGYKHVYHFEEIPGTNATETVKDSTHNKAHFNSIGAPQRVNGKLAGKALFFNGVDTGLTAPGSTWRNTDDAFTWSFWANANSSKTESCVILAWDQVTGTPERLDLWITNARLLNQVVGPTTAATIGSTYTAYYDNLTLVHSVCNGVNFRANYLNGIIANSATTGTKNTTIDRSPLWVAFNATFRYLGVLDELRIATVVRSAAWIKAEYDNQNGPGAFFAVAAPELSKAWKYRLALTIPQQPHRLTDFPVYVDLSLLPALFHQNVKPDGSDIRIATSDGEVPVEVVFYGGGKGELYFKATLSDTAATLYYIYFGNPSAMLPARDSTYGSENVWSSSYKYVYHMQEVPGAPDAIQDSTRNRAHLSRKVTGSLVTAPGKLAGLATRLNGTDGLVGAGANWLAADSQITMQCWIKIDSAYNSKQGAIFYFGAHSGDRIELWTNFPTAPNTLRLIYGDSANADGAVTCPTTGIFDKYTLIHAVNNGVNFGAIYIDGVSTGTDNTVIKPNVDKSGFSIGYTNSAYNIRADIDEVRISTTTRSPGWIDVEYRNQNNPSGFYSVGTVESRV